MHIAYTPSLCRVRSLSMENTIQDGTATFAPKSTVATDVTDALEGRAAALENRTAALETAKNDKVYCEVFRSTGGDYAFSGTLVCNSAHANTGCYNHSTGVFTAPVSGLYTLNWSCYSNQSGASQRMWLYYGGRALQTNGPYGNSISIVAHLNAGQTAYIAASATYPASIYAAADHNVFSVALIKRD